MAGFSNDVVYANNVDFSGGKSATVTADGQLLIGSTASPNIRVANLTPGAGITITNGPGTISIGLTGGSTGIDTIVPNSGINVVPNGSGNVSIVGTGSITTVGTLNTLTPQLTGLTNHAVLIGAGTATITKVGPVASTGAVLMSNGVSSDPGFSTATYPAIATGTGTILRANGTNWVASTATYPDTAGTSGNILTSNGTNWTSAAPATSGTVTSVSGTANQVAVATGTTTPVISLIGPYTPATYTAHGVLVGEGTSSIAALAAGSAGQVLQSGGASADPAYSTATYPTTATGTGTLLRADGTNWAATTSTYPNTNAVSTLLYASSANVMGALATANSGVLTTSSSGVPSIDTTNFAVLTTGVQMKGNNTNTAPPAGFIGEQIRSFVTAVSLTSPTPKTVTSISLTAGIWDVSGVLNFSPAAGTATTQASISISATNNTLGSNVGDDIIQYNFTLGANGNMPLTLPSLRITLSSTTTYYLVGQAAFTVSTLTVNGRISATRVG